MKKKIDTRKIKILKLIVEEYIKTGDITWSKSLLKKYELWVSSATVRSDMAFLEKMWLIFQPYNSAGRLPTTRWIRVFVDYLMEHMPQVFIEAEQDLTKKIDKNKIDDTLYLLVSRLTKITWEITFACVPSEQTSYYLGLSNFIQKNIISLWDEVYNVIKVLENKYNFIDLLKDLEISNKVSVFIWEENIIPDLESCAMVVKKINLEWKEGYLWILWSLKMDYAFNIGALKNIL
ncbi:MAG: Heat-inducible transcription repressor HrcA [uncultured bacterium (gcode 4)]|uniref:Heat-inducible transcription repressor HrcA n=1 Tax=uncultured bacterium (gcode 4) TaxID=1234023 RepID=K2F6C1_9BACT|nr:MAG: Heat-inducible transcription repressor HrcA [uncultured bacterium (gcode 4)]